MVSTIVTKQEEGEIQRFQKVEGFMWEKLRPQAPPFDKRVIGEIARLYQVTIIPKNPAKFGWFVFFRLDEALPFSLPMTQGAITFLDRNLAFASYVNGLVSEGEIAAGDRLVVNDPVLRNTSIAWPPKAFFQSQKERPIPCASCRSPTSWGSLRRLKGTWW